MSKSSTTSLPSTIQKWQYTPSTSRSLGLEKALYLTNVALPPLNPNHHLIRLAFVALNPVDVKPAESPLMSRLVIPKLATPGIDFSGTIITPAAGSSLKAGQRVFGTSAKVPFAAGALAEVLSVEAGTVVPIPSGVSLLDAATIPVAGLTAYQTIIPHVKPGDHIFINGGSGGTGVYGIQIAKAIGCSVTTTCSTPNVELCRSLGADHVIDYKRESVVEALKRGGVKYDHIVDNVGSDFSIYWNCHYFTGGKARYIMAGHDPSGRFMLETLKIRMWPRWLGGGKRVFEGFFAKAVGEEMGRIVGWMGEGKVRAVVDERFRWEEAPKAVAKLKTGRARGKIVVEGPVVEKGM